MGSEEISDPGSTPNYSGAVTPNAPAANLIRDSKIAIWTGAQTRGETGVAAAYGCVAFAVFEIPAVPDFSSERFHDLSKLDRLQRLKQVGARQDQFLASLQPLWPYGAVSLRYICHRTLQGEARIRVFLIGRSYGETEADALNGISRFRDLLRRSFPEEYPLIDLQHQDDALIRYVLFACLDNTQSLSEIVKPEQVIPSWHDPELCGFSFYYVPVPFASIDNEMVEFCRALIRDGQDRTVIVDLCLTPTAPLTVVERAELETWMKVCERWGREQRTQIGGGLFSAPSSVEIGSDRNAGEVAKTYADLIKRYGYPNAHLFLYGLRVLWTEREPPAGIASALSAFALAPSSNQQLIAITPEHAAFQKALNAVRFCYVTPAVCNQSLWSHPEAPETLRRLHRIVDVKEAAGFFRLPIPGRDGCPGIPLDAGSVRPTGVMVDRHSVTIGQFIEGRSVTREAASFAINDLAKHSLIVGTPGSGKTTLCFSLLEQLWTVYEIPFIVLEPAKSEYRALLGLPGLRECLLVFTVGNERVSPFRFNPFEVLDGVSVAEHISALNACFCGAFSLWDPLPSILDEALREIYADRGWSEYGIGGDDPTLCAPTLQDLYRKALGLAERKSYRGEVAGNIRGALETRLGSLIRGPKGRCFNTARSVPARVFISRPVILELEGLNDEEKALMMMFVLNAVREYARATRKSGAPLSHVLLVEEAHNVIGRGEGAGAGEHRANPKGVAIRFFTRMLAEMRALGEGLVVADQLPTAIAPEAVKNTNIKVMHRLVSADDRQELGQAMLLDSGQFQLAATLPPGQSLVFMEGWPRSRLVAERNLKERAEIAVPPDDSIITGRMAEFRSRDEMRDVYLPYTACRAYCSVCKPQIREQSERMMTHRLPDLERALLEEQPLGASWLGTAFTCWAKDVPWPPENKLQWACAFIHFREEVANRRAAMSRHDR